MIQLHDKNTARDEALPVLSSVRDWGWFHAGKVTWSEVSGKQEVNASNYHSAHSTDWASRRSSVSILNSGHRFPANSPLCLSRLADPPCRKKSVSNGSGKFHFLESCQCVSLRMVRDRSFVWSSRFWPLFDHGPLFHNYPILSFCIFHSVLYSKQPPSIWAS